MMELIIVIEVLNPVFYVDAENEHAFLTLGPNAPDAHNHPFDF